MVFRGRFLPQIIGTLILGSLSSRADSTDVPGSRDYPGFPRPQGYIITDYDEDNPAEFDFQVSRPLPVDLGHIEKVHVRGHRYIIQYVKDAAVAAPTLLQLQHYYEKFAAAAGFTVEKNGAVGDVSETFHRAVSGRETWISVVPAITSNNVSIVEGTAVATTPPPPVPPNLQLQAPAPVAILHPNQVTVIPTSPVTETPAVAPADPNGDQIFEDLTRDGRAVVPLNFLPGRLEIDDASQGVIERIAMMMKHHPELYLRIEGHTDNSGDEDENLRLSAQRAFAVQDRLALAGIDKTRLDPVGVGGLQPIADNATAQGRAKNRRIELVLRKKPASIHASVPMGIGFRESTS
jgi:outer membrane protein OmpA-like peptidoglycan-associated protein